MTALRWLIKGASSWSRAEPMRRCPLWWWSLESREPDSELEANGSTGTGIILQLWPATENRFLLSYPVGAPNLLVALLCTGLELDWTALHCTPQLRAYTSALSVLTSQTLCMGDEVSREEG
ncbi:hypothetical protein MPTK1_3g14340 [Marchantia polymorpha subsp. ruderalis]|uniref:Uncharacterized protein n=2 Tax=Marchantia polymorpha TaxID=3197 RepID=A0AAF6B0P8_MARPO|nr:hypothetical protein MARPO_0004s0237 [Marchantia polymorpha]BBN05582.1 hypothetical protein Mp_3g14340 [Marchantia polymorpha subsp. ruderalis]|eukprot:PTQ49000.1 hypothetical protein MARPO_0004s0237 [Marchantia polymorpha]